MLKVDGMLLDEKMKLLTLAFNSNTLCLGVMQGGGGHYFLVLLSRFRSEISCPVATDDRLDGRCWCTLGIFLFTTIVK